ncbi:MAG: SRPBCC family protein [Spirochaetaceae bacterium]|nr:SRPBCC family protein [Spirochaetaceae bacterium]
MVIKSQITINSTKDKVWKVITDIENSLNFIRGIEKIEILEQNGDKFIGLKWKETRTMFGQTATEIMWITDAKENEFYSTRAESHGAIYVTEFLLSENNGSTELSMHFTSNAVTFKAKLLSIMFFLFAGATKKAFMDDLIDIKAAVEKK